MFKLNRMLPAIGAAALLATLVATPANAAEPGGAGAATFGKSAKGARKSAPACKEMTMNGGFELPKLGATQKNNQFNEDDVQAWRTDDPAGKIEIWNGNMGVPARFGKQLAELNATGSGNSVYQDIKTMPSTKIYWSFWIRARDTSPGKDVDATQIHFGRTPKNDGSVLGVGSAFAYKNTSDDATWKRLYGWYKTGSGQTSTRVTLTAVESASTDVGYGNLVDGLTIVENPDCI